MFPSRDTNRHGIVVAVAGWYLISPPSLPNPNGQPVLVDVDRPLREWKIERSFDTVGKCQSYRNDWIIEQRTEAEKLSKPAPSNVLLEANLRANSRCVANDELHPAR
jgi:hypothetical protein